MSNISEEYKEEKFTKSLLERLHNDPDLFEDESFGTYYKFYSKNNQAGYAFYILRLIFMKIEECLGINVPFQDPWSYFSYFDPLQFKKCLEDLRIAAEGDIGPPLTYSIRTISDIRTIEGGKRFRKTMIQRITDLIDLDPAARTFEPKVLQNLLERNKIFNEISKEFYKAREREINPNAAGIRRRIRTELLSLVNLDEGTDVANLSPVQLDNGTKLPGANPSDVNHVETETKHKEGQVKSTRIIVYFKEAFLGLLRDGKDPVEESCWKTMRKFTGSTPTVVAISIVCLMASIGVASWSLFTSLSNPDQSQATGSDLFNSLQQAILLLFSQYVLVIPYLRGLRLNNESFWFLVSLSLSTFTTVASVCIYSRSLPVSTFLGYVSNALQVVATLFLVQENAFLHPLEPDPASRESSEQC